MWEVAGVLGILLAAAAAVWYKYKAGAADDAAAQVEADKRAAQDEVAAARDGAARTNLQEEARKVLEVKNEEIRKRLALDLLARFRGTR